MSYCYDTTLNKVKRIWQNIEVIHCAVPVFVWINRVNSSKYIFCVVCRNHFLSIHTYCTVPICKSNDKVEHTFRPMYVLVTSLNNTKVINMIYQRTTKNLIQYYITKHIVSKINLIWSKKLAYLAVNILVVVQISLVRSWLRKTSYSFRFLKDHAVSLIP